MKRKLVSLVLSLAMAVQATGVTAMGTDFAQESTFFDSERESIISTLQFVANAKGDFNLDWY